MKGAEHFSEIVQIARELTTDKFNKVELARLTAELLTYQTNRPIVCVMIT